MREHVVSPPPRIMDTVKTRKTDTKLLFHASHASQKDLFNSMIHAPDHDVLVITMAASSSMSDCESWVAFGHGATLRYIPCHLIAACLGGETSQGLLFNHVLLVCDSESSSHGIDKTACILVGVTKHA